MHRSSRTKSVTRAKPNKSSAQKSKKRKTAILQGPVLDPRLAMKLANETKKSLMKRIQSKERMKSKKSQNSKSNEANVLKTKVLKLKKAIVWNEKRKIVLVQAIVKRRLRKILKQKSKVKLKTIKNSCILGQKVESVK